MIRLFKFSWKLIHFVSLSNQPISEQLILCSCFSVAVSCYPGHREHLNMFSRLIETNHKIIIKIIAPPCMRFYPIVETKRTPRTRSTFIVLDFTNKQKLNHAIIKINPIIMNRNNKRANEWLWLERTRARTRAFRYSVVPSSVWLPSQQQHQQWRRWLSIAHRTTLSFLLCTSVRCVCMSSSGHYMCAVCLCTFDAPTWFGRSFDDMSLTLLFSFHWFFSIRIAQRSRMGR